MSPVTLSLFPSSTGSVSRKASTKRPRVDVPNDAAEVNLRGVAFQVVTPSRKTAQVQPAANTIKHSLFCDTSSVEEIAIRPDIDPDFVANTASSSPRNSLLRRQSRTRRKSGPLTMDFPVLPDSDEDPRQEDSLSDLPQNTNFTASTPPRRSLSTRSHLNMPQNLSTVVQPDHARAPVTPVDERKDRLSPLPDKTRFTPPSTASKSESSPAFRAGSPTPSPKTMPVPESFYETPMRSMFPIYDPTKPFDRQSYYPSPTASPPPAYLGDNVSKIGSPAERQNIQRFDSGVGFSDGYEHTPSAAHGDMQALWKASCEDLPVAGRKTRFGLHQPTGNGKTLAIGASSEDLIYVMERDESEAQNTTGVPSKQFSVRKHCPTSRSSSSVSTLVLPDPSRGKLPSKSTKEVATIFPHAAATHAIEAALGSSFDAATAQSPEATREAITKAHRLYCCDLIKRTRKRDSLGSVTAHYDLVHPMLGTCPVTVTKSLAARSTSGPRAKISLHHPSATPAAVAADTLNLACIDFAHQACVLDIPGLMALDSHYIIDTVVSTLLAVAVIENDALVAEELVFQPPPKTPLNGKSKKQKRRASVGMFKRSATKKEKKEIKFEPAEEQVELGGVAKGVLAVMEFTFKASAWVIITGAKVGFEVVGYGVDKIQKRIG